MKRFAWVLAVIFMSACGSVPATHYYVLAPPSAAEPGGEPHGAGVHDGVRLGVETFTVDPPYDQDRLVYRIGRESGEVGFYGHHRWAAPPGRLVSTALAAGLRGLVGLASAEPARTSEDYSLILAGRVLALEEIDLQGRQLARIQVDLKLVDPDDDAVIWSRYFEVEADGQAEGVSDVMRQMQSAFSKLVGEVRGELEAVLSQRATTSGLG